MRDLLNNWRVLLLLLLLVFSFFAISFNGLPLGVDLSGGTLFQIHLAESASSEQISSIRDTIQQRLDWTGLKDTHVTSFGSEFIIAQIAETDPEQIEKLEALLKKQGKFEVVFDGEVLFTGADIISIPKDPGKGYGFREEAAGAYLWMLPFSLKESAAVNFSHSVFHRCTITSYAASTGRQYECERTYFFIDRPGDAVLLIPQVLYDFDSELLLRGNRLASIPEGTDIEELLHNSMLPYFVVGEGLSPAQVDELTALAGENGKEFAISPPSLGTEITDKLTAMGYKVRIEEPFSEGYVSFAEGAAGVLTTSPDTLPWTWQVTGAKQVISLSEDVTNLEPYVANVGDAKILSELLIRGYSPNPEEASEDLKNLTIILESGSLPVPVESVSKETISPSLGKEFLQYALYIGLVALAVVALVIFVRYRLLKLTMPILFTALSEIILILGFSAFFQVPRLDLAALAGVIATVGTGVDHQIIITDELMRGFAAEAGSLVTRVKRAFFIIMAAALTTIATMSPIILFGFGLGKLVGFAITIIIGVLLGVLITRPAYAEIAKYILSKE